MSAADDAIIQQRIASRSVRAIAKAQGCSVAQTVQVLLEVTTGALEKLGVKCGLNFRCFYTG